MILYTIKQEANIWRIVAVGDGLVIPLPFRYRSKNEAQRELDRVKKVAS